MNIWNYMYWQRGKKLRTLGRNRPFTVRSVGEVSLAVVPRSSGRERIITRSEIEGAFNELWISGELTLKTTAEHHSEANASYIVTLLAQLPDVDCVQKPICLFWKK
jgi:hypothetical protein